jgi:hypothetical protein
VRIRGLAAQPHLPGGTVKALDGRHRWVLVERKGARVTHACRVCGLSKTFELLVPDVVLDEMVANFSRPNIYRTVFR